MRGHIQEVIHVGYPKAGSTWLQTRFFPVIPEIQFSHVLRDLHYSLAEFELFYDSEAIRRMIDAERNTATAARARVFSHEGLVVGNASRMPSVLCRRLKELFPEARILVVIRNQRDILPSRYQHDVRKGLGATFRKYLADPEFEGFRKALHYDRIVDLYRGAFPQVHVALFERLFSPGSIEALLAFIGAPAASFTGDVSVPVNRGLSYPTLQLTRLVNRISGTHYQKYDNPRLHELWRYRLAPRVDAAFRRLGLATTSRLDPDLQEEIAARYRESNRRLQGMFDFDIREHGYAY